MYIHTNHWRNTLARFSSEIIPEEILEKMVRIFKAISNPVRLQIVNVLLRNECRVGELAKALGAKQSLTSQRLSNLKFAGVLKSRRDGNKTYYSLANNSIRKIIATIIDEL